MKFTIDRPTWRFGGDVGYALNTFSTTYMCNPITDKMCCLGQVSLQLGVCKEKLAYVLNPQDTLQGILISSFSADEIKLLEDEDYIGEVLSDARIEALWSQVPSGMRLLVDITKSKDPSNSVFSNSVLSEEAISANDSANMGQVEREKYLVDLFAAHGHELEFVGEYTKQQLEQIETAAA